jgi:hypothetical protein
MSVTLNDGDLVWYEDGDKSAPMLVDGEELHFQFGTKPFELNRTQMEQVLSGEEEWTGSGRFYKCYDAVADVPLADPQLAQ